MSRDSGARVVPVPPLVVGAYELFPYYGDWCIRPVGKEGLVATAFTRERAEQIARLLTADETP